MACIRCGHYKMQTREFCRACYDRNRRIQKQELKAFDPNKRYPYSQDLDAFWLWIRDELKLPEAQPKRKAS